MTKPPKFLAVVGATEETIAHLRLLLRMGGTRLQHDWTWGGEHEADFIVVEPGSLAADATQTRCQAGGIPFAVLAEPDALVVQGMVLRRPLKLDQIVAVFNAAGASSTAAAPVQSFGDDFYTRQIEETIPTGRSDADVWDAAEPAAASAPVVREAPVQDLDHMLYGDPLAEPVELGPLVGDDTQVDETEGRTARSDHRRDDARERMAASLVGVSTVDADPIPRPSGAAVGGTAARRLKDDAPRPLLDFLQEDAVASPVQLRLDEAPAITLDPLRRQFHAAGQLGELAPYVEHGIPADRVAGVAGVELARVRLTEPARGYDELRWLTALLRSGGTLHSRLDPGGTYLVREPLLLDPDFYRHGPITAAMKVPTRLHEIARMSGASMVDVFDVVNAYDSIGRLEWSPRPPRAAPEPEKAPASALSRLKWPFGRK
ncbi:hypothetical protein [Chiayiivirga flava]|uniref:Uncharacterized protein n=1 Tax=Chiayiivirga flava TaxID=659595 RepID=A0A7W8D5Y6_9GAMM|nr:hypothetical protein [Chiayiivirga flava]MBB5207317.1 hypothetical protein [Chiayiivirga flava]